MKDTIYQIRRNPVPSFEFNQTVAKVFNDMIHRSVPFYPEIISRQAQMIAQFYQPGSLIYDLGCSNGNLEIAIIREMMERPFTLAAVDNSESMLAEFRMHLKTCPHPEYIDLTCADITQIPIKNAGIVVINLTLQFLPIESRDHLIRNIYQGLIPNGLLFLTEKLKHADDMFASLHQEFYYRFKKEKGYSELEISQKREALENILIPETMAEHRNRLENVGFNRIDIWFQWFNFSSWICRKVCDI